MNISILVAVAGAPLSSGCRGNQQPAQAGSDEAAHEHAAHEHAVEGEGAPAGEQGGAAPPAAPSPEAAGAMAAPSDVAAAPSDSVKTASGLASKVLRAGTGTEHPKATSIVRVHYSGWTTDGAMFDSSYRRGEPAEFPLNRVISGWTEGLQLMVEGEKRRFWIPESLAYQGRPGGPQGMLVFDVELLSVIQPPEAPPAPTDVAAPPRDAQRTASGLAHKRLALGTGTQHPQATSNVRVHYSGWTTDGNMFDSSVVRGRPAEFPLNRVIAGWTEGLQLMVVGEKRRFWIPEALAYQGQPGSPAGMLVFDVELLAIDPAPGS